MCLGKSREKKEVEKSKSENREESFVVWKISFLFLFSQKKIKKSFTLRALLS